MKPRAFCLVAALALGGCAAVDTRTPVTQKQIDAADVGPAPGTAEQARVKAFMELRLKDSASAQYRFGDSRKSSLARGSSNVFGWECDALINAKNSYGGYTGFQPYRFFFANGEILGYQDERATIFGRWIAAN